MVTLHAGVQHVKGSSSGNQGHLLLKTSFDVSVYIPFFLLTGGSTEEAKTTTTTTTTTPEVGHVKVELCELIGSDSCSVCATATISEFTDVIFSSYWIPVSLQIQESKYSQGAIECLETSQPIQVVKLVFNTNDIRPTEITIYGNGKQFLFPAIRRNLELNA